MGLQSCAKVANMEEKMKVVLSLVAIALASVGWLSLREVALKRIGKKADIRVIVKAVVAWVLVGLTILMIVESIEG